MVRNLHVMANEFAILAGGIFCGGQIVIYMLSYINKYKIIIDCTRRAHTMRFTVIKNNISNYRIVSTPGSTAERLDPFFRKFEQAA